MTTITLNATSATAQHTNINRPQVRTKTKIIYIMKDTNQVQQALEVKAKKELQKVVDEFMISMNRLNSTYRQPNSYDMSESGNTETKVFYSVSANRLENILHRMLVDAYLEPMVNKKTKELLNKLELI